MTTMPRGLSSEEMIANEAGLKIFVRSLRPAAAPKAILVICHGVNSHSGQYGWAIERFAEHGLVVYALDLRGRGRSEGERFYIDSVDEYVADLAMTIRLAKQRHPGLPLYLLGHSAGGVVSCTYALDNQVELAGLICESFAFQVYAPDVALALIKGVSHLLPHTPILHLKNEDFSRDPAVVAALNADPLTPNETQPTSTVAALVRADERLEREFPRITLPLLIMHGTADNATRPSGSQPFFDTAGASDKSLKLYEGHFHDLLADVGKEQVLADMWAWIEARLGSTQKAAA
ncbi:MAG: lysophospholipase [Enhydrobacter sp.]|nr:lysophospholipase [Enhydrobacter sp.]